MFMPVTTCFVVQFSYVWRNLRKQMLPLLFLLFMQ